MAAAGEAWRLGIALCSCGFAALWVVRTRNLHAHLARLPDLSAAGWDLCPARRPELLVVVPARDEAATLEAGLGTLLAQDYPALHIVAVNDRSTDATGHLLEDAAARHPEKLEFVHVTEPAEGWLSKTFAMAVGAERRRSDYLLFTHADTWISPSLVRRAVAYAEVAGADLLTIMPTPVTAGWAERALLLSSKVLSLWFSPPWRPVGLGYPWEVQGAHGGFDLVRREALEEIGGLAPQRLTINDGLALRRRIRAVGLRQKVAFASEMLLGPHAPGAGRLLRSLARGLFAQVGFRLSWAAGWALALFVLFLLPLAGLGWWATAVPGLVVLGCMVLWFRAAADLYRLPARFGFLLPFALVALWWAMLRSAAETLCRRGVSWRATYYPLRELQGHNKPFAWEREAATEHEEARLKRRRARRQLRPRA